MCTFCLYVTFPRAAEIPFTYLGGKEMGANQVMCGPNCLHPHQFYLLYVLCNKEWCGCIPTKKVAADLECENLKFLSHQ